MAKPRGTDRVDDMYRPVKGTAVRIFGDYKEKVAKLKRRNKAWKAFKARHKSK